MTLRTGQSAWARFKCTSIVVYCFSSPQTPQAHREHDILYRMLSEFHGSDFQVLRIHGSIEDNELVTALWQPIEDSNKYGMTGAVETVIDSRHQVPNMLGKNVIRKILLTNGKATPDHSSEFDDVPVFEFSSMGAIVYSYVG